MNIPLTPDRANALKFLRLDKQLSPKEMVQGTPIIERTYSRWERREVNKIRESNLAPVLARLGVSISDFLRGSVNPVDSPILSHLDTATTSTDPLGLLAVSEQIDKILVSVLQSERVSLQNGEVYKDLLYGGLMRRGFSIQSFTKAIQRIDRKRCIPQVTLNLEEDLKNMRVLIGSTPVLQIDEPRLLWDCSCVPKELVRFLKKQGYKPKPCAIHSHRRGGELMDLTSRQFVELRFQMVNVLWRQSIQLWPPSIDSIVMLRNLKVAGVFDSGIESILDLGCGTGILGIHIARHNPSVRRLGLADWLLTPLLHAALNVESNLKSLPLNWQIHLGMFNDWIIDHAAEPYDLLVCTPPYLPAVDGFDAIRAASPVAGTELIKFLVQNRPAKQIYVTVSSMVEKDIKKLAGAHDATVELVAPPFPVPFRVPAALRSVTYISSLLQSKRLDFRLNDKYPLWHRLMTFRITAKRNQVLPSKKTRNRAN